MKRQVKNEFMMEEWEFDTQTEMESAAQEEAHVCGDNLDIKDMLAEIHNYHFGAVRWRGRVVMKAMLDDSQ